MPTHDSLTDRTCFRALSLAGLLLLAGCAAAPEPKPMNAITETMYAAALKWFDDAAAHVDELVPAAEKAADQLIAGGTLWTAGNPGFSEELFFRAGGFPFTKTLEGEHPAANDVLLIGDLRPNEPGPFWERVPGFTNVNGRLGLGLVVHLASHNWPSVSRVLPLVNWRRWGDRLYLLDTRAPSGESLEDLGLDQMATVALAWAFQGEVIAAATRKGATLTTYASSFEPGGDAWDATVKDKNVHDKFSVPPIPAGKIGKEYLGICRRQAEKFLKTQPGQVRLAARRMAACMKNGGAVWVVWSGHVHERGAFFPPQLPRLINFGREYSWFRLQNTIPKGDMLLRMGYLGYPRGEAAAAVARGADVVTIAVGDGPTDEHRTHIDASWDNYDTVIDLEKYPIRVLPSSGVASSLQWYALMAETVAAYRAAGGATGGTE